MEGRKGMPPETTSLRFPPPWTIEEYNAACFILSRRHFCTCVTLHAHVLTGRKSMLRKIVIGALSATAVMFSSTAFAQGTATEAKAMLEKAVVAVNADKAKALDTINKGEGGFLDRDLYVFWFNSGNGNIVATGSTNPASRKVIGLDVRTLKDATGKVFGQDLYDASKERSNY
jgi:hypothetical protein